MWAGKDPILRSRIGTHPPPVVERFRQPQIQRYGLTAGFRLAIADTLHDDGAGDRDLRFLEIDVTPFQRQQLTNTQTGEHVEEDCRACRFLQKMEQCANFLQREHNRNLRPLGALPHQA